jgi:hypothetical protein
VIWASLKFPRHWGLDVTQLGNQNGPFSFSSLWMGDDDKYAKKMALIVDMHEH